MARPERSPYSRQARARVAYSVACRDLSELARDNVPTSTDRYGRHGSWVEDAVRMAAKAQRVLELAVILERERSSPWDDIGQVLGITKQAAHERFSPTVDQWRKGLVEPTHPSIQLPDGAEDPATWAHRLDEWVLRHLEPGDPDHGNHPVSATLFDADQDGEMRTGAS